MLRKPFPHSFVLGWDGCGIVVCLDPTLASVGELLEGLILLFRCPIKVILFPFIQLCYLTTALKRRFCWPHGMSVIFISEFSPRERKSDFHRGVGKTHHAKFNAYEVLPQSPETKQVISRKNKKSGSS